MFKLVIVSVVAIVACANAYSNPSDVNAQILKFDSNVQEDGNYQYAYETSNSIAAQENGIGGHYATGSYSYYSPEGVPVQVSYVADENGYQPSGDVLPTPPPIPYQILKALEYIRTHPQYDDSQHQQPRHGGHRRFH